MQNTDLTNDEIVAAAKTFLGSLTDEMQSVAVFLTPEEEQQIKDAFNQSRSRGIVSTEKRDAVPWDATNKAPDDTPWDWPSADQRLRKWSGVDSDKPTAAQWAKYQMAFAWFDPTADDTLGGYKLPHHDVIDGKLCVVIKGVQAAMAALNGARGGTTIPAKDMDAVYQHLTKHYHQFGVTPPDQARSKIPIPRIERRLATFEQKGNSLVGRAAAFNSPTTIQTRYGSFIDQIKPGAFTSALAANCNCRALVNHNPDLPLGSTQAGNVILKQTDGGLDFEIRLLDTNLSNDVKTLVQNKVLNSCSFSWDGSTSTDEWDGDKQTLTDIPDLLDVSIVTYPAYENVTSVDVRSLSLVQSQPPDLLRYRLAMLKARMPMVE